MKKSPVNPKYATRAYGADGFDPYVDYTQFLEEARQYAKLGDSLSSSLLHPEENGKKKLPEERKGTKSWKTDKKNKPQEEPVARSPSNSIQRRRLVSGPIHGAVARTLMAGTDVQHLGLSPVFSTPQRVENDIPYVCLDQLDRPMGLFTW